MNPCQVHTMVGLCQFTTPHARHSIAAGQVHLWWPSVSLGPPCLGHVGFLLGPLLLALLLGLNVLSEFPGEKCTDEEEWRQAEQHIVDELAGALGGPFHDGVGPGLDDVHHYICNK